ncbi:MAG: DPP IV N-terminal domain-containing protein [Bacteroidales bacterium]|nr:DPP IV N-terminal domain-containing protein [Bacteroidales bacterium]
MRLTITVATLTLASLSFAQQPEVSIADLCETGILYPNTPDELRSTPDGKSYTIISPDGMSIEQYSFATGAKEATLLDLDDLKGDKKIDVISGYEVSSTGEFIMIWGNINHVYRRSFTADHYIVDVAHKKIFPISETGGEQEAAFSPNGYIVSYVKNNDLYLFKLKYRSSSEVTKDGEKNKIINGIPDWVNEEEFSISRSYAWSTDSKQLAFIKYDETDVPQFSFPVYAASHPRYEEASLYPSSYTYKYPKAGENNAKVSVHIFDVDTRTTKQVDLGKGDFYVPRILWTGQQDQLAILKLNRLQNKLELIGVNARSLVTSTILTETDDRFVDEPAYNTLQFINGGTQFVIMSERDGWSHLYLYETNGSLKKKLTEGEFDVTDFYGTDEKCANFYYQAAKRTPMEREVYAYNLKKGTTTAIASKPGTNEATFSTGCRFFVGLHSSAKDVPTFSVFDAKGKQLRTIISNSELKTNLTKRFISTKEFIKVPAANGSELNAWIMKPRDFTPSKKYPMLMVQYSGPNSQEVLDQWGIDWCQTLAARGYIVACVDPRGTGARGAEFRKCTYLQMGKYESDDQIAAAKYFGTLPYVDASRIGIWGWSFGGFTSSLCLGKSDVFKIGIAVAPVINWRFYDSVYTERFMRMPADNASGYDDNSPIRNAANLSGRYFIIAGSADDNVHYQNQMEMVDALVQAGKQFDMFTYPNRNHSIYGGRVRSHLYNMKLNYILKNL